MAAETHYTANTGLVTINVANSSLSGGTIGTNIFSVITGASSGTLIETVTIKATGSPGQGMVRLFTYNGTTQFLLKEIVVDPILQSTKDVAFEKTIELNYVLQSGFQLLASTQNADTFNIIAQGLDISYFTAYVRPESTNYITNVGMASITVGTSSMTGTGSTLLTSATSGANGTIIESLTIKAQADTLSNGIIRIFIYNGTTYYLLSEVFIPFYQTGNSSIYQTFEKKIIFSNKIKLKAGYSLYVSTQNSDAFNILAEGMNWSYPPSTQFTNYTSATTSGNTTEHILHAYQIPAGFIETGNLLRVYGMATYTINHGKAFRIYINTSNSLTGATQIGTYDAFNTPADNIGRLYPVISDTVLECYGSTTFIFPNTRNEYTGTTQVSGNITVPSLSAGFWLLISGQNASVTDTTTLVWSMVEKLF
jgi:hypothetical protein